jgi:predicted branched-subunit amino acid permease
MAPLDAGGIAYGIVVGVLAAQRGLLGTEAVLMSVLVYSGSGQVAALDLRHNPLPYLAIWLATVLVGVRCLVLGAALLALAWPPGPVNVVDDEPAPGTAWLPVYAAVIGAPPPVRRGGS